MKRPLIFTAMCEIEYKNYNALIKNTKYCLTRGHSVFLTETGQHKKVWKWSLLLAHILLGAQVLCLDLAFQSGSFHSLPWLPKQITSCSIFQISPPCCFSQGWLLSCCQPRVPSWSLFGCRVPTCITDLSLLREQSRRGQSNQGINYVLSPVAVLSCLSREVVPCFLLACLTAMLT